MEHDQIVYVIDDDKDVTEAIYWLIQSVGYQVKTYHTTDAFFAEYDELTPSCMILDVRMPGMSGLELQEKLLKQGIKIPIIFITAHADVTTAVRAMKSGAEDFLTKPLNSHLLLESVYRALRNDNSRIERQKRNADIYLRAGLLTPREREVMKLMVAGKLSKTIASTLNISVNTVETHRAKVMKKMQAKSLAELVALTLSSGLVEDACIA